MDKDLEAEISSAIAQLDKLSIKSSESGLSEETCWEIFGGPCPEALKKKKKELVEESPSEEPYFSIEENTDEVINNESEDQHLKEETQPDKSSNNQHNTTTNKVSDNSKANNRKHDPTPEDRHNLNPIIEEKEFAKPDSPKNHFTASMDNESISNEKSSDNNKEKIRELHENGLKNHKKVNHKISNSKNQKPITSTETTTQFDHEMKTFSPKEPNSEEKIIEIVNYELQRSSPIKHQSSSTKEDPTEPSQDNEKKAKQSMARDIGIMTDIVDKKLGADKSMQTSDRLLGRASSSSSTRRSFSTTSSSTFDETDLSATDSLEESHYRCRSPVISDECLEKPCRCHSRNLVKELKRNLEMGDSKNKFKISRFQDDTKCNKKLQTSPMNLQEEFRNPYKINRNDDFNFYHIKNAPTAKDSDYTRFINSKRKKFINSACQYDDKPKYQKSSESDADDDDSGKFWKEFPTNNQTLSETLKKTLEKRCRVKQVVDKFEEQKADFGSLRLPCMSYFPSKKVPKICTCCCKSKI